MVNEKSPLASNCFVARLAQFVTGSATLVEASTVYVALAGPLVPLIITFVPDRVMLANFGNGTPATSSEPSTSSLFVQLSPGASDGNVTSVNAGQGYPVRVLAQQET